MTKMMALVTSILATIFMFHMSLLGIADDKPPEPSTVEHTHVYGRIYLDATIDQNNNIHLIWMCIKKPQQHQNAEKIPLYYQKGESFGKSWSIPKTIPICEDCPFFDERLYPRIFAKGDSIIVFWSFGDLFSKMSLDGGQTWGPDKRLIPRVLQKEYFIIPQADTLYIVFANRDGTFFSNSIDFGVTWAAPKLIGTYLNSMAEQSPICMTIKDNTIHVVGDLPVIQDSNMSYQSRIYYLRGKGMGREWDAPRVIDINRLRGQTHSISPAKEPKILLLDNELAISFREQGLSYIVSSDDGDTWTPPTDLPTAPPVLRYDICALGNGRLMAIWLDFRYASSFLDNNDLFYAMIADTLGKVERLTSPLSYAEVYFDAIFCGNAGDTTVVIWGGMHNASEYLDDSKPSDIFIRVFQGDR